VTSIDFVMAAINDSGTMLDLLEQLEADFAPALQEVTEAAGSELARMTSRIGAGIGEGATGDTMDAFDRIEAEQAQEDLAAVEQDIPRARDELLKCGVQLVGVQMEMIMGDCAEPLSKLFTAMWDKENSVSALCSVISSYLHEQRSLLDPVFYDKLSTWVMASVVSNYTARLVVPEAVPKLLQTKFAGGFSSRFKLTDGRIRQILADEREIQQTFSRVRGGARGGRGCSRARADRHVRSSWSRRL